METDRHLFRAGTVGYTYPEILEVKKGSLRLLRPSGQALRLQRVVSALIALGWVFGIGSLLGGIAGSLSTISPVVGIAEIILFIGGLLALTVWWDQRSLPLLVENPAATISLDLLSIESQGTFQEIRVRSNGAELRVAIPGPRQRLERALALARPFASR